MPTVRRGHPLTSPAARAAQKGDETMLKTFPALAALAVASATGRSDRQPGGGADFGPRYLCRPQSRHRRWPAEAPAADRFRRRSSSADRTDPMTCRSPECVEPSAAAERSPTPSLPISAAVAAARHGQVDRLGRQR